MGKNDAQRNFMTNGLHVNAIFMILTAEKKGIESFIRRTIQSITAALVCRDTHLYMKWILVSSIYLWTTKALQAGPQLCLDQFEVKL